MAISYFDQWNPTGIKIELNSSFSFHLIRCSHHIAIYVPVIHIEARRIRFDRAERSAGYQETSSNMRAHIHATEPGTHAQECAKVISFETSMRHMKRALDSVPSHT